MVRVSLGLLFALSICPTAGVHVHKPGVGGSINADAAYQLGASALNLTSKLIATADEKSTSGLDHSDANFLRKLGAELSAQSEPEQTQPGAKVALELGVDALKLGAKLLEKSLPSESLYEEEQDSSSHTASAAVDRGKMAHKSAKHHEAKHNGKSSKFLPKETSDEADEAFDSLAKGTYFDEPSTINAVENNYETTLESGQSKDSAQNSGVHNKHASHKQEQPSRDVDIDANAIGMPDQARTSEMLKLDSSWGGVQSDQPPPALKLIMKHMSKTGGSLMIALMNNMTQHLARPDEYHFVHYVDELSPLRRSHGQRKSFVISSVRNPCDWYVDLWSKTEESDRQVLNKQFGSSNDPEPFFDNNNLDAKKFANWMSWALGMHSGAGGDNVMSVRFWETLIAGKHVFGGYNGQRLDEYMQSYIGHSEIESALETFAPSKIVDCWVRDESYAKDLRSCLSKYEQLAAVELNWEPFVERFGNRGDFDERFGTQGTSRGECLAYYTPELAETVLRGDKHMFQAFGYDTCCGSARRPIS